MTDLHEGQSILPLTQRRIENLYRGGAEIAFGSCSLAMQGQYIEGCTTNMNSDAWSTEAYIKKVGNWARQRTQDGAWGRPYRDRKDAVAADNPYPGIPPPPPGMRADGGRMRAFE